MCCRSCYVFCVFADRVMCFVAASGKRERVELVRKLGKCYYEIIKMVSKCFKIRVNLKYSLYNTIANHAPPPHTAIVVVTVAIMNRTATMLTVALSCRYQSNS